MLFTNPLNSLFDQATKVKVLRRLFVTRQEMTIRQIAASVGVSHVQAGQSLASLATMGVVTARRIGKAIIYRVNLDHVLSSRLLTPLFEEEGKIRASLASDISTAIGDMVQGAYFYGSFASGLEGPESDLDLLVLADSNVEVVESTLTKLSIEIRTRYGTELNYMLMTLDELKHRHKEGGSLIAEMVRSSLVVKGPQLSEMLSDA